MDTVNGRRFHGGRGRRQISGRRDDHFRGGGRRGRGYGRGRGRFHNNNRGGPPSNFGSIQHNVSVDPIEILGDPSPTSVNIAIEGCCHGELDRIYERIEAHEKETGQKIDLLICCGDFQSHRNAADFHSSSIPPKYQQLGTFPRYYSGEKVAPILTLFIGGNHEASQPLRELFYGGWVAPNIYYIGAAGVVRYRGIRIGGISGIYKSHDYTMGHFGKFHLYPFIYMSAACPREYPYPQRIQERPPFDRSTLRSVYHVRNIDIYRMKCLSRDRSRLDIAVSHDWPLGVEQFGNTEALLRKKPFFRAEVERNDLGSPPNREVLEALQPRWWFAAHLHVKFAATVKFSPTGSESPRSLGVTQTQLVPSQVTTKMPAKQTPQPETKDTIEKDNIGESSDLVANEAENSTNQQTETNFRALESSGSCTGGPTLSDLMTKFLALDKCLPRRQYLSIVHLESEVPRENACLEYDPEWLAIIRKTHDLTCTDRRHYQQPTDVEFVSDDEIAWIKDKLNKESNGLAIPLDFQATVPFQTHPVFQSRCSPIPQMGNPQMDKLLNLLELKHNLTIPYDKQLTPEVIASRIGDRRYQESVNIQDENEIDIDTENDIQGVTHTVQEEENTKAANVQDENEIELDDEDSVREESTKAEDFGHDTANNVRGPETLHTVISEKQRDSTSRDEPSAMGELGAGDANSLVLDHVARDDAGQVHLGNGFPEDIPTKKARLED